MFSWPCSAVLPSGDVKKVWFAPSFCSLFVESQPTVTNKEKAHSRRFVRMIVDCCTEREESGNFDFRPLDFLRAFCPCVRKQLSLQMMMWRSPVPYVTTSLKFVVLAVYSSAKYTMVAAKTYQPSTRDRVSHHFRVFTSHTNIVSIVQQYNSSVVEYSEGNHHEYLPPYSCVRVETSSPPSLYSPSSRFNVSRLVTLALPLASYPPPTPLMIGVTALPSQCRICPTVPYSKGPSSTLRITFFLSFFFREEN